MRHAIVLVLAVIMLVFAGGLLAQNYRNDIVNNMTVRGQLTLGTGVSGDETQKFDVSSAKEWGWDEAINLYMGTKSLGSPLYSECPTRPQQSGGAGACEFEGYQFDAPILIDASDNTTRLLVGFDAGIGSSGIGYNGFSGFVDWYTFGGGQFRVGGTGKSHTFNPGSEATYTLQVNGQFLADYLAGKPTASAPSICTASAQEGRMYYDTDNKEFCCCGDPAGNGYSWYECASGATETACS